ncbi:MAG: DUF1127 domain-containing protein [Sneathiella sp.]
MNVLTPTPGFISEGIQRTTFVVLSSIESLYAKIQQHLKYRKTVLELSALDDRELSDIGLVRGDIDRVAQGLKY